MAGALGAAASCAIAGHHVWLHAGPMFHLADAFAIWASFWLGGRQVCMRFSPDAAVRLIGEERVTHTLGVPTMVDMIGAVASGARTRLSGVQALFYGGAPMPAAVFERAREALDCPLVATYGMTETSDIITCAFPGEASAPVDGRVTAGGEFAACQSAWAAHRQGEPVASQPPRWRPRQ